MVAAFALLAQAGAQVSTAGADGQGVRAAAVFNLVDGVDALVHQRLPLPADGHAQAGTPVRDVQQAVAVVQ